MSAPSRLTEGAYRGLNLDVGRKAFVVGDVIALVRRLAELDFTALHLHLSDTHRLGVALPGYEALAATDAWSARECAALAEAAEHAGIALIPEVDLPSHAQALLAGRPELHLADRTGTLHPDLLDVSRPEALELATRLLDAADRLFPGDAIHLGGDEYLAAPWEEADAQRADRFPRLVAHARAQAGPEAGALDAYALFMNALIEHAASLGRTAILWNDHVVPAAARPAVPISTDAVLEVWIRWRDFSPSVTDLIASGYRVLNAHGDQLYAVLSADGPPAPHGRRAFGLLRETFHPRRFMAAAATGRHLEVPRPPAGACDPVLGAELSLWCDTPDVIADTDLWPLLDTWLVPFAEVMAEEGSAATDRA